MSVQRIGDIEVGQDLDFQRREWVIQRVAWYVMVLILILAVVGIFGRGPIAQATARADDASLLVRYDRVDRRRAPAHLEIELAPGTAQHGQIEVWIAEEFLRRIELRGVLPEPAEMRGAGDRTIFVFAIADPNQSTRVTLDFEHESAGRAQIRVGLVGGPDVTVTQFVFP